MAMLNEFLRRPWDVLTSTLEAAGQDLPLGKKVDAMVSRAMHGMSRSIPDAPASSQPPFPSPIPGAAQPRPQAQAPQSTRFFASMARYSWALALLGVKDITSLVTARRPAQAETPISGQPAPNAATPPAAAPPSAPDARPTPVRGMSSQGRVHRGRLDLTRFIVMGEGLAAGMGDFSLTSDTQRSSFPALMAAQMMAAFPQALLQPPGIGGLAGFSSQPVLVPAPLQSTVLDTLPPGPVSNLSVPGLTVADALDMRPSQPLIHRHDAKQTALNLILGALPIAQGRTTSLPSQLEYALQRNPTFTVVELGYYEAITAALHGSALGDLDRQCEHYARIIRDLKSAGSEVLVLTVPDPFHTAHFASLHEAAAILKVEPGFLTATYALANGDLLTVKGLNEIGFQIFGRTLQPLPQGSVAKPQLAKEVAAHIHALNERLTRIAHEHHAHVCDLHALFLRVRQSGVAIGNRRLTAQYLGGFYSLNGFYPGATGQAVIANEVLQTLNRQYDAAFPLVDLAAVLASDPVAAYRPAAGPDWDSASLQNNIQQYRSTARQPAHEHRAQLGSDVWTPIPASDGSSTPALRLPATLEQVLTLNKEASYFGDGISAINGRNAQDIQWGSSGGFLFGGLAMVDSHLGGNLRIRFSPPVNNVTDFEISFTDALSGDDAVLTTPQYFKMAFQQNQVAMVPKTVSGGKLNLQTGEITGLTIYASYRSTALLALVGVNPTFPKQPLSFPGQYGSAWARFDQRADGNLDFTFYGSTFVPLGKDIVWPLNFAGPSGQYATVPANGTVMHPHLQLSTRAVAAATSGVALADLPFNTIQEFTLYTHNSSFGDAFHLNIPAIGGPAKGRSELLGRLQIQFGIPTGNSVPFAVWALTPGGIMGELPDSPVTQVFPGRLFAGPQGFNESLRFPQRTYSLDDLAILDDPFDICVGALDLRTGRSISDVLHRAFISQDLIFALLRVEPRTPKDSFFFRGPALLQKERHGGLVFRFQGIVGIPYPAGFQFPRPDFATGFTVGDNSRLDPFLWFHAVQDVHANGIPAEGSAEHVRASTGDDFSYRYRIPAHPGGEPPVFEYVNNSQQGSFSLHSLAWVGFSDSGTSTNGAHADTVTFSGFGVWSKDGVKTLQQAAVQISTSREKPYVGIQIAGGDISNVNTKPMNEPDALP